MPPAEPMVLLTCRVPALMKAELEALAAEAIPPVPGVRVDRSMILRQLLADGIRRARAAGRHPALLPDDLRPTGPPA